MTLTPRMRCAECSKASGTHRSHLQRGTFCSQTCAALYGERAASSVTVSLCMRLVNPEKIKRRVRAAKVVT